MTSLSFSVLGPLYRRLVPRSIASSLDVFRALRYWKRDRICFIHIPKNAGVSISKLLYSRTLGHITLSQAIAHAPSITDFYKFSIYRSVESRYSSAINYLNTFKSSLLLSSGLPPSSCMIEGIFSPCLVAKWLHSNMHRYRLLIPFFIVNHFIASIISLVWTTYASFPLTNLHQIFCCH